MRIRYDKRDLYRAMEPVGYDIGDTIRWAIIEELGEGRHWVTGELALSYEVEARSGESSVEVEVGSPLVKAAALHTGSKPHWVPFRLIYRWAMLKIAPVEGFEKARDMAQRVWRKIQYRGTTAYLYLDEALRRGLDYVERKYSR